MQLNALLLCSDSKDSKTIETGVLEFDYRITKCKTAGQAWQTLQRLQFDLLVIDLDSDEEVAGVVETIRSSGLGGRATIIGVVSQAPEGPRPIKLDAHYYMDRSLGSKAVWQTISAAHRAVTIEKRQAIRHAVFIPTAVSLSDAAPESATIIDLSPQGMCLLTSQAARTHQLVELSFLLPGTVQVVHVVGRVSWVGSNREMGVRFTYVPPQEFRRLRDWLTQKSANGARVTQGSANQQNTHLAVPSATPEAFV
jgi:PilZ domain-containing protein